MTTYTATYSPDDNKLRLYASTRLDKETYERVKAHGFKWAPKQGLFVAPMWTPGREDLLVELAGEVGDEDTSLTERAEERADRFEGYRENRTRDAESAHNAVKAIADHIPLGQPILVGHHSEKRARRDAEKIENGMRKAVRMWDTANYWKDRAAGAIRHAKYKERSDVRARRIKTIEADKRKKERERTEAETWLKLWGVEGLTLDQARAIANRCWLTVLRNDAYPYGLRAYDVLRADGERPAQYPGWTVEQVQEVARRVYPDTIAWCNRWIAHYDNRLAYERAMLADAGGLVSDKFDIQKGGRVLVGVEWLVVLRVNKTGDVISSVTTNAPVHVRWCSTWKYSIEEIKDYRAPSKEEAAKVEAATKLPPLCNYPGAGFVEMTAAEYKKKHRDYKCVRDIEANDTHGAHRLRRVMTAGYSTAYVYLTDVKRVDAPKPATQLSPTFEREMVRPSAPAPARKEEQPNDFDRMRESLNAGVQVVSAPQLFPTPADLAARMIEAADIEPGHSVLEPSAGTGHIVRELIKNPQIAVTAVEIRNELVDTLRHRYLNQPGLTVRRADFLKCNGDLGKFDRIVMNPPFADAEDIEHITHALHFLKPGGRLVAICANGPRQNDKLRPLVEEMGGEWEVLPPDTFKESGTGVNTVLITLNA